MESVANRTETRAVVDNNIQASSKDITVQLSTLLPLTECAMRLIVGGTLQMQLLLLLLRSRSLIAYYHQKHHESVTIHVDLNLKCGQNFPFSQK